MNNILLIDCIAEITNKPICMDEDKYLYFGTFEEIEDDILVSADKLKAEKEKSLAVAKQIAEAKQYLSNTDYKMLPNYVPKVDEDLGAIIANRNEVREFIRGINNDNYRER